MSEKLTKEQINKFYLGPLTKFVFIPLSVLSLGGIIYNIIIKDNQGIAAGLLFVSCSICGTILSYINDLRRNK